MEVTMRIKSEGLKKGYMLNSFGDRVAYMLKEMRLTKTWLAEQLQVSKQNINYLLKYASKPRYSNKISELLEVNKDWLLTGNGPINLLEKNTEHFRIIPLFTSHGLEKSNSNSWDPAAADAGLLVELDTAEQAFAIRLETDLGEPMFKSGNTLIFVPNTKHNSQNYQLISCHNNSRLILKHPALQQHRILYSRHAAATEQKCENDESQKTIGVMIEVRITFDNPRPQGLHEIKIKLPN
jgi:hypothetical protein